MLRCIWHSMCGFITLYSLLGGFAMVSKGTHNYQISPFFDEFNNIWEWWCDNGKC